MNTYANNSAVVIDVEYDEGIERLFFELASESRLCILRELQKENLKMQEIARRLDVTATEAFRQLERLSGAMLVQRLPDGAFTLAAYGKLVLQLATSLEFASQHREYFTTHDLTRIPHSFINRLGELAQSKLGYDTVENMNRIEQAFMEAEEYIWGIAEGTIPQHMNPIMEGKMRQGVKMRFLIPENRLSLDLNQTPAARNVEGRGLVNLPAIVVLTEKLGGVCFRDLGGKVDYAGFFGEDPVFRNWVKELFLHYWEKGKRP